MSTQPGASPPPLDRALQEFLTAPESKRPAPSPAKRPQPALRPFAGPPRPAAPLQDADELRSAYDRVLTHEAEKAAAAAQPTPLLWRRLTMPALVLVLGTASAYVWFGDPFWMTPVPHVALAEPTSPRSGQRQLVAIALQIEDFRRSTGRLPRKLEELGLNLPHISYVALPDSGYELHQGTGPHFLSYQSGANAEPEIRERSTP